MSDSKQIEIYRTKSTLLASIVKPRILAARIGRRGTKTWGVQSPRSAMALHAMPGCIGAIAGNSYRKVLDILLPEILAGWSLMGLREYINPHEGGDYVIGKAPPKTWPRPIICPRTFDNLVCTKWGSALRIISMDHGATLPNGQANDFLILDEVKELNPDEVRPKLLKTLSGHPSIIRADGVKWGDLPEHCSLTLTTDGYYGPKDHRWIEHWITKSSPQSLIDEIVAKALYLQNNYSPELELHLWQLQRKAVMYISGSSLEALAINKIDYYVDALTNSTPLEYRASILNEDVKEIEGGYYTLLDESKHTYKSGSRYSIIDKMGMDSYLKEKGRSCKLDDDWKLEEEIHLSLDYGTDHTWAVVMQKHNNTFWLKNNFWSDASRGTKFPDMIQEICEYYKPHINRVIRLYDDPGGHKAKTDSYGSDVEKVQSILRANGWRVIRVNQHNRYARHHKKYRIINYILDESKNRDNRFPHFKCNLTNANESYWSMAKAPLKRGTRDEFQKDKGSERPKPGIPQWQATHLSDAVDNILYFSCERLLDQGRKVSIT